ncbi:MAG: WYL domain-containing protein [Clostridia bacterium]|nr:WYL domain-containing protein [Clostridia bacterium]
MKFTVLLDILSELLRKRRITAAEIAEQHGVSARTAYRYIDLIATAVPVSVRTGRNGGAYISDSYKLPSGYLSQEEYDAVSQALAAAYAQTPEERFLSAKRKLFAEQKQEKREVAMTGDITSVQIQASSPAVTQKLNLLSECIRHKYVVELTYLGDDNKRAQTKAEPHALIFYHGSWQIFAFCHTRRDFHFFTVGKLLSCVKTETRFRKRPFKKEHLLTKAPTPLVDVRLELDAAALPLAQDALGAENCYKRSGKWYASAPLPDDEKTYALILSLGVGVKVLSPLSLQRKIADAAAKIVENYSV